MNIFLCVILFWFTICAIECSNESKKLRKENELLKEKNKILETKSINQSRLILTLEGDNLRLRKTGGK